MLTTDAVRAMRDAYQLNPAVQELCDGFLDLLNDVADKSDREADLQDVLAVAKYSLCGLLTCVHEVADAAQTIDRISATLELRRRSA